MANEMFIAAARRGGTENTPEAVLERMIAFYVDKGFSPEEALAQARRVLGFAPVSEGGTEIYDPFFDRRRAIMERATELARRAEEQARYRANPRLLSDEAASPESLPGYDPTREVGYLPPREHAMLEPLGRLNNQLAYYNYQNRTRPQIPAFSQPMTAMEAHEARITRPMPRGDLPGWRPPSPSVAMPQMTPFRPLSQQVFEGIYDPDRTTRQYNADYQREQRAYDLARRIAERPAQTYQPAGESRPILNAGVEPPRFRDVSGAPVAVTPPAAAARPSLADIALRNLNPFYTPVSPPTAAPAASGPVTPANAAPVSTPPAGGPAPMRAEDLDGPSAFRQAAPLMTIMPETMNLPTAPARPQQAVRRAVQVARSVMPSNPPLPPPAQREPVGAPMQLASAAPQSESFFSRLLASQPDTRSSRELFEIANQSDSPADFFRAERAMREGRAEGGGIPEGMMGARPMPMPSMDLPPMPAPKPAGGGSGSSGGTSAAINKALEIIHHLVMRGR